MQAKDLMSKDLVCCTRDTKLQQVARLMVEHDCGAIPVMESHSNKHPIGIITDRDITCRTIALGKNPLELTAGDCMTASCVTVSPDCSVEECCQVLEDHQLRRVLVVDNDGCCCGIIAQADIARMAPEHETAEVVKQVSADNDHR